MLYLTNLDLNKNQLQNALLHPQNAAPSSPSAGQVYYNTVDKALYQSDGTSWTRVGITYSESSAEGKLLAGLSSDGGVTTVQVKDIKLVGYTAVADGYVSTGVSLESAIAALDTAVKNAVAGGGEINQYAFSKVKVGQISIDSTGKTDTIEFIAGSNVTLTPNTSNKTVTIDVSVPNVPAISTDIASDLASDSKTASPKAVKTYVDNKLSTTYKAAGSATNVAGLGALNATNLGKVYNMSAAFTTTSDFVEGAGISYPAGTNVVIVQISSNYKYDVLSGFVDLSNYALSANVAKYSTGTIAAGTLTFTSSIGTKVLGVTVVDSDTHEVVLCDATINGNSISITLSSAHTNALEVIIIYV